RLGEQVAVRPVQEGRARADGGDVHRVPGFVQKLVQVVDAPDRVGGEHPRLATGPVASPQALAPPERGERDRVLPFTRTQVVPDLEPTRVRAQVLVETVIDRPEDLERRSEEHT